MRGFIRTLALAALLAAAQAKAQEAPVLAGHQPLTREQVLADLLFFRDQWAPRERAFSDESRARMLAFVNRQIAEARPMRKTELALIMSRAMAYSGNNHTRTRWWNEVDAFEVVPVSFWWFPEGAMVTRAHPDHRDLIGAEIVSIGGVPAREALDRVVPYIPGTADTHLHESPAWLRRLEVLRAIGLSDGRAAEFVFRLEDGRRVSRRLVPPPRFADPERYPDPAQYALSWRQSLVPGRGPEPWPHILDRLPSLPLHALPPASLAATELEDGPAFWAEGDDLTTPAGIPLHYTDGFHDWARGCRELARCFWPVVYHGTAVGSLAPDLPATMRFSDFVAGRDPALEAALADIAAWERR